ncbi:regulator of chromosome condensation domain-containing protein [Heterostelium album PN500]|uniref:Regulator of chromosome condensation domain-containing protein n=1 Tax=Heterostelium pallidum (strain ATCC 26659 / Pp 5 / PN500) TaxID=670386 RepID=D3AX86_HETP5|nr:regulator of chromosome condensation domain-containing protein [Heterostelium album PN500]EFA86155.1 regulator of chromosome condensation domain-containing protein [Heterostelium album PN500]|eukprot:XP_020438260.1 regulator of chromosome condensation domain-containing protein [Heterostelium album PN500]
MFRLISSSCSRNLNRNVVFNNNNNVRGSYLLNGNNNSNNIVRKGCSFYSSGNSIEQNDDDDSVRHQLWMFGSCNDAKLGLATDHDKLLPTKVTHLPHRLRIKSAQSTWQTSCILTEDNQLFMWGTNSAGQMGLPQNQIFKFPTLSDMFKMIDIDQVHLGRSFTLILTSNKLLNNSFNKSEEQGKLLSVGSNDFGQLGLGEGMRGSSTPRVVEKLNNQELVSIGAGFDHSMAVTKSGHTFGWGYNVEGQIGQRIVEYKRVESAGENVDSMENSMTPDAEYNIPTLVPEMESIKVAKVYCGYDCSFLVSARGNVYAMGNNETGTLGVGDDKLGRVTKPTKVAMPEKVKQLSCGATHTLFLAESGRVYSCGWGSEGRLGLGDNTTNRYVPTLIPFFHENGIRVTQVSAGGAHSMVLTDEGQVYTWGCGENGKLGHNSETNSNIPQLVKSLAKRNAILIAAGIDTSMVRCSIATTSSLIDVGLAVTAPTWKCIDLPTFQRLDRTLLRLLLASLSLFSGTTTPERCPYAQLHRWVHMDIVAD